MLNDSGIRWILVDSINNFPCAPVERAFNWIKRHLNNKLYDNEIVIYIKINNIHTKYQ